MATHMATKTPAAPVELTPMEKADRELRKWTYFIHYRLTEYQEMLAVFLGKVVKDPSYTIARNSSCVVKAQTKAEWAHILDKVLGDALYESLTPTGVDEMAAMEKFAFAVELIGAEAHIQDHILSHTRGSDHSTSGFFNEVERDQMLATVEFLRGLRYSLAARCAGPGESRRRSVWQTSRSNGPGRSGSGRL